MKTISEDHKEILSRYEAHASQVILIEKKIRQLTQELEKYQGWMQEARKDAREIGVDLD